MDHEHQWVIEVEEGGASANCWTPIHGGFSDWYDIEAEETLIFCRICNYIHPKSGDFMIGENQYGNSTS